MAREFIEQVGGVAEYMDYDEATGDLVVERVEDAQATVDAVRDEHLETGGKSKSSLLWHIGELPYTVWSKYGRMRGLPDNWIYRGEYADELIALVKANPLLSPTGGKV